MPPFVIFQGKHHLSAWYKKEDLPHNWVIAVSENGWTTDRLGLQWLKHFDMHIKRHTVGMHQLLILDGHESYHSLRFQQYCKENNINTLCMPHTHRTYCSHLMYAVLHL
jgi:hypothetical protein